MHTIVAQRPGVDQTVTLTPGAGRPSSGRQLRPSIRQQWNEPRAAAPPSVSFTDLNTFANDEKLLPINEDNDEEEEEEEVEYVYEDEPAFDEAFDEDEQPGVGPNYPSGRSDPYDAHRTAYSGAAPGAYGGQSFSRSAGRSQFDQYGTQGLGGGYGQHYNTTSAAPAWGQAARPPRAWGFSSGDTTAGAHQQAYGEPRRRLRYQPRLIDREKIRKDLKLRARIVAKLTRRNSRLVDDQKLVFDKDTDLEDLKTLSETSSYSTTAKTAVLFMRRGIVIVSKLIEVASLWFPELMQGYSMKGWSNHLFLSMTEFDEMLYDVYDEYFAHLEKNPLAVLLFGLASNAVVFVLAKKVVDDPRVSALVNGFSTVLKGMTVPHPPTVPLDGESKTPMGAAGTRDMFADGDSAGVATPAQPGNPLAGIAAMFDGAGIDVNSMISGISKMFNAGASSGAPVADLRGQPMIQEVAAAPVPMTPVSARANAELEDILKRHEDAQYAAADNTATPPQPTEAPVATPPSPVATRSTDTKTVLTLE